MRQTNERGRDESRGVRGRPRGEDKNGGSVARVFLILTWNGRVGLK